MTIPPENVGAADASWESGTVAAWSDADGRHVRGSRRGEVRPRSDGLEEEFEIFGAEARPARVPFREEAVGQVFLSRLERQDFLFDTPGNNQLVHEDRFVLTNAMRSVGRLRFDRGIPPWIIVNDRIRRCQIEPRTSRLEADQEEGDFAALEGIHHFVSIFRLAGQLDMGKLEGIEAFSYDLEHFYKL